MKQDTNTLLLPGMSDMFTVAIKSTSRPKAERVRAVEVEAVSRPVCYDHDNEEAGHVEDYVDFDWEQVYKDLDKETERQENAKLALLKLALDSVCKLEDYIEEPFVFVVKKNNVATTAVMCPEVSATVKRLLIKNYRRNLGMSLQRIGELAGKEKPVARQNVSTIWKEICKRFGIKSRRERTDSQKEVYRNAYHASRN